MERARRSSSRIDTLKMNDIIEKRTTAALVLLEEVESILKGKNERNWIRGIRAALAELRQPAGGVNFNGFENARSIYLTMTADGRGFSEYFIWDDDESVRLLSNAKLDRIRERLWSLFDPAV